MKPKQKTLRSKRNNTRNNTRKNKKPNKNIHKKTKKINKFKNDKCAPKKSLEFTCYDKQSLYKLKNAWNKKHPNKKIKSNVPKEIWKKIKYYKKNSCKRESCWLKQEFIKNNLDYKLKKLTFAPKYPKSWYKNENEWLNSMDILNIFKQYEHKYQKFKFIGPSPIDYDTSTHDGCVWNELCNFNLSDYIQNKKRKIGIVFNLDTHDKGGSHWVALFIDANKKGIYYFDSYGDKIPNRINNFVKTVQEQSNILGTTYNYHYNNNRHQYKGSECGMYCLYFIIHMLKNKDFDYFLKNKISDDAMLKLRKQYFNY